MRLIFIPYPPHLPRRWNTVYQSRVAALAMLVSHQLRADYFRRHSSWNRLKAWLSGLSSQKCWYCEAKSPRAPFDVDHFRPKLRITADGVTVAGHTGYYWLGYECSNFRLSCQRCNRPENDETEALRGKHNEFPLRDEAARCNAPGAALEIESPRLLDPCVEADCVLLAHGVDGEVKPVAADDTWEFQRARYTIDRLGFNEWNTPEAKRSRWQTLATLIVTVGDNVNPAVVEELKRHLSQDQEYSSFFRSAIGTHRDKAWVEALL